MLDSESLVELCIHGPLALPTVITIMHSTTQHFGVRCLFSDYWFLLNILIHKHRCRKILSIESLANVYKQNLQKIAKITCDIQTFSFCLPHGSLNTQLQGYSLQTMFYCFTTLTAWLQHPCKLQIHAWIINKGFMVMSSTPTSFLALVARPKCQVSESYIWRPE